MKSFIKLHHVPVIIFISLPITLCITFFLSYVYYDDHVTYFLPYISDTGTFPPESCIFGQVLNCMVILMAFVMYIKYLQVEEIFKKHNLVESNNINKIAFVTGLIAVFGVQIVANFQETNILIVHWFGAILCFGFGAAYQCLHTIIYLKISPIIGQQKLTILRIFLAIISTVTFAIFSVTAFVAYSQFNGKDFTKWKKEDGGFFLHQISSYTEWICASCTMTYFLLLSREFKNVSIEPLKVFVFNGSSHSQKNVQGGSTISVLGST